jgi:tetratricopeptide (TPR) repeat protein
MPVVDFNTEENVGRARALCQKGLWPDVLAFAQQWHAENPVDYKALYYAGLGFSGTNQFAKAEAAYRLALTMEASDFKVWNNLAGLLYENMRRENEGIQCIEAALKIDPGNKLGWSNLASMVGRMGRHDRALECAGRALALDPKFVEAHLHKGNAARALGKTEVVQEVCIALAAIEPEQFRRAR